MPDFLESKRFCSLLIILSKVQNHFIIWNSERMKEVNIINEKKYFIVPGILLFLISFLDGLYQFNVISYASLIYLLIAALVLYLGIIGIGKARIIMYVLLCYHILSIWYPSFYSMLFPYNNLSFYDICVFACCYTSVIFS